MLGADRLYCTASSEAKGGGLGEWATKWPGNRVQNGLGTVTDKCLAHLPVGIKLLLMV